MKIGQNVIEQIEPGFTFIRYVGTVGGEDAAQIMDGLEANVGEDPFILIEADMTQLVGAAPEARRITAERLREFDEAAVAIVSKSFAQRMIAKLVLTAVAKLGGTLDLETGYFSNSDDARAWLREYAAKRRAELAST